MSKKKKVKAKENVKEKKMESVTTESKQPQQEQLAAIGQLVASVTHELRNPLGTIRTSLYTIAKKTQNKGLNLEKILARAERNMDRCNNIIDDLLDYTRVRELNLQETQFDDWCTEILDEFTFPEGITVKNELNSEATITFEQERMCRCIINVLNNACQAIEKAELNGAEHELKIASNIEGNRLNINITDTGSGIPKQEIGKIFEPLYSTKKQGIGLGLPIVKQILEQHSGGVSITSDEGHGTAVHMWLPLHKN